MCLECRLLGIALNKLSGKYCLFLKNFVCYYQDPVPNIYYTNLSKTLNFSTQHISKILQLNSVSKPSNLLYIALSTELGHPFKIGNIFLQIELPKNSFETNVNRKPSVINNVLPLTFKIDRRFKKTGNEVLIYKNLLTAINTFEITDSDCFDCFEKDDPDLSTFHFVSVYSHLMTNFNVSHICIEARLVTTYKFIMQ